MKWDPTFLACVLLTVVGVRADEVGEDYCSAKTDMILLFDTAPRHGDDIINNAKQFAKDFLKKFVVAPGKTRVSLISYGSDANVVLPLSDEPGTVSDNIDSLPRQPGVSGTGAALEAAREQFTAVGRADAYKVLLLFFDGNPNFEANIGELQNQAQMNHGGGITTFAILGLLNVPPEQFSIAKMIASQNPAIHVVRTFKYVGQAAELACKDLAKNACIDKKPCQCTGTADQHIHTCDGGSIIFRGKCRYLLAKTRLEPSVSKFRVVADLRECNGLHTDVCSSRLKVQAFGGQNFTLLQNGNVELNGAMLALPFYEEYNTGDSEDPDGSVDIYSTPNGNTKMMTNYGLVLTFHNHNWQVTIPKRYTNAVVGLCGNYDNDLNNDYTTRSGESKADAILNGNREDKYKAYNDIGESYAVPGQANCGSTITVPDCSSDRMSTAFQADYCGQLKSTTGPFGRCIAKYQNLADQFFEACIQQVCGCPSHESPKAKACQVIEQFVSQCLGQASNYVVRDWRAIVSCPMLCGPRQLYTTHMSACPPTCAYPYAPKYCNRPTTEGCKCEPGFIMEGGTCIPISQCGCIDHFGKYHKLGSSWMSPGCRWKYTCKITEAGKRQICEEMFNCAPPATCTTHNGYYGCWFFGPCIKW